MLSHYSPFKKKKRHVSFIVGRAAFVVFCTQVNRVHRWTLGRGVIHLKMPKDDLRRSIVTWIEILFQQWKKNLVV